MRYWEYSPERREFFKRAGLVGLGFISCGLGGSAIGIAIDLSGGLDNGTQNNQQRNQRSGNNIDKTPRGVDRTPTRKPETPFFLYKHPKPPISAVSAYLVDADTEEVLFDQKAREELAMLSTTKEMTALLAAEQGNLDQQVTITQEMIDDIVQVGNYNNYGHFETGQQYSLRDLLSIMLLPSTNDTAVVIADHTAIVIAHAVHGNLQTFIDRMNQRAGELGLTNTHYVNPHGLLDNNHYSCARDLVIVHRQVMKHQELLDIEQTLVSNKYSLVNVNQFAWWYQQDHEHLAEKKSVVAGKTGYSPPGDGLRFIQVESVRRGKRNLICAVMYDGIVPDMWTDMRILLDYGSDDFGWSSPQDIDSAEGMPPYYSNAIAADNRGRSLEISNGGLYFIGTGYTVEGDILKEYLPEGEKKFGLPISQATTQNNGSIAQKFEKGILVDKS